MSTTTKRKSISYAKWGYIFILPFFIVYITCSLIPLITTIYNSFFNIAQDGIDVVNYGFIGFNNYVKLFKPVAGEIEILNCLGNTMIMWVMGAVPQFIFSLILAVLFTSARLKIKGQTFFKTVIYMPNVIMAASFSILFFTLFSAVGPVNQIITSLGGEVFRFFDDPWAARSIIAFINFLMWFGNTTILLMAGIMGIDQSLFEAASIDGASSTQVFFKITLPLLMPILVYVAITSLIGGLQMFDVPQVIGTNTGVPQGTTRTMIMYLNHLISSSKQYGLAGAVSMVIFVITAVLSIFVYKSLVTSDNAKKAKKIKGGK